MSTARAALGGAGTTSAGAVFGGATPPGADTTATEEFTGGGPATFTVGTD